MAIVVFTLPVTIYKIMTFNISKWSVLESMIFKKVNIMRYNADEYVTGWRFNPLLLGVPDWAQHELCSIKVEITQAVDV